MRTPELRTPQWLLEQSEKRLRACWAEVVCGADGWKPRFELGTSQVKGARLKEVWAGLHLDTLDWRDWVSAAGEGVVFVPRQVGYDRAVQEIPAAVLVDTIDDAARLLGADWVTRLARARDRRTTLATEFPALAEPAAMLRATDAYGDVDFELLCRTAAWFAAPHPAGLTARQVPVEGLGTKWLDAHQADVRRLAGLESLDLEPGRPPRVHLTYLDPTHLAAGGRRHDVATVGDVDTVAYRPRVVLISENRDTAQLFPPVVDGIAIEGEGRGAGAVAALPWVRAAESLHYWGDMDADGLEILHGFRAAGLPVRSLFMDLAAYRQWERYGVDHDHGGRPLKPRTPREVSLLEPAERDLYLAVCSPDWPGHRRIEQERIPLADAAAVVRGG
ncbi:MAG TPA: Wadjet anti-phage system protein JetD domain-containing protein [Kribbellaceae bacterium]|nr:Wadjet anti-phage system protein JetD domain-containing protein [Kribbellaceae bacterium]